MLPDSPEMNQLNHTPHAQCLRKVQGAMQDPSTLPQARKIYETLGVYLGYAVAQYCEHLPIKHVMLLGRVAAGVGGKIMMDWAKKVLDQDFPDYSNIKFHTPNEQMKQIGQCVASVALPEVHHHGPHSPGSPGSPPVSPDGSLRSGRGKDGVRRHR